MPFVILQRKLSLLCIVPTGKEEAAKVGAYKQLGQVAA
jgi:hypothetical protein